MRLGEYSNVELILLSTASSSFSSRFNIIIFSIVSIVSIVSIISINVNFYSIGLLIIRGPSRIDCVIEVISINSINLRGLLMQYSKSNNHVRIITEIR